MSATPSANASLTTRPPATKHSAETRGLALGLLGVVIFALTLPMTRLAVGTPEAPLMSGLFIAMGLLGPLKASPQTSIEVQLPTRWACKPRSRGPC